MNPLHVAAITLGVFFIGCSKPQQALTPADEKLIPVYTNLLVMSEEFRSPGNSLDSTQYQAEVQSVLTINELTKEEFSNRLKALAQMPDVFQQFQTKVYSELEHRRSKRSS